MQYSSVSKNSSSPSCHRGQVYQKAFALRFKNLNKVKLYEFKFANKIKS